MIMIIKINGNGMVWYSMEWMNKWMDKSNQNIVKIPLIYQPLNLPGECVCVCVLVWVCNMEKNYGQIQLNK